jgi:regulatory protein
MAKAAGVIRRRDVSSAELADRLRQAAVAPVVRAEVVTRLSEVGAVDDDRFARRRAELLADRNAGDLLIRHDLAGRGIPVETIEAAIAALEPERTRAARVAERRGTGPKTARFLARKGFSEDALEVACVEAVAEDAPSVVR